MTNILIQKYFTLRRATPAMLKR